MTTCRRWIGAIPFVLWLSACGSLDRAGQGEAGPEPEIVPAAAASPSTPPEPAVSEAPQPGGREEAPPVGFPEKPAPPPEADGASASGRIAGNWASQQSSVHFPLGEARVSEAGKAILQRHAERLKKNRRLVVTLVSYADLAGSRSYNLAIAEKRMDAVADILRAQGVAKRQIRRVSAGRAMMGAACKSPLCRQQMRRVELVYQK